jgi:hypothetical protein
MDMITVEKTYLFSLQAKISTFLFAAVVSLIFETIASIRTAIFAKIPNLVNNFCLEAKRCIGTVNIFDYSRCITGTIPHGGSDTKHKMDWLSHFALRCPPPRWSQLPWTPVPSSSSCLHPRPWADNKQTMLDDGDQKI